MFTDGPSAVTATPAGAALPALSPRWRSSAEYGFRVPVSGFRSSQVLRHVRDAALPTRADPPVQRQVLTSSATDAESVASLDAFAVRR
jgi:hypothetical protein